MSTEYEYGALPYDDECAVCINGLIGFLVTFEEMGQAVNQGCTRG